MPAKGTKTTAEKKTTAAKKAATPHVFHLCQGVSPLRGKTVNQGSVTEAYAENATRITKQIPMEQSQCGFGAAKANPAADYVGGASSAA